MYGLGRILPRVTKIGDGAVIGAGTAAANVVSE